MNGVSRGLEHFYCAITYGAVARWKAHPQFDDIVATANLEVWRKIASFPPGERDEQHRLVAVIAKQAAIHFLRSPENESRRRSRSGTPLPERLSLAALEVIAGRTRTGYRWYLPRTPDFAPRLIEHLWRQWVWERAWRAAGAEDRAVLQLHFREGVGHEEIGRRFGKPANWSWRRVKRLFREYAHEAE